MAMAAAIPPVGASASLVAACDATGRLGTAGHPGLCRLLEVELALAEVTEEFSAEGLLASEAVRGLEVASRLLNLATTVRGLLAKAVRDTGAWDKGMDRSAGHFVGRLTGTSIREADDVLETAAALEALPETEAAARRGELSGDQMAAVTKGATANPKAEGLLLDTARRGSLGELKDQARKVRFAAEPDPEARRRRIYEQRSLRTYADQEGIFHLHLTHAPEVGAKLKGRLDPLIERFFQDARRAGVRERPDAYAADALVAAVCGDPAGAPTGAGPKVIVRIDHGALVRGHLEGDEVCEVAGVGPISVAAVKELALNEDPFWAAVVTKGHDVVNVAHLGRHPNAFQRTALEWLYPGCAVRGCNQQVRIEWDHRDDWARTHVTALPRLDGLCSYHHRMKTTRGWMLVEGRGKRDFVAPTDPRHPARRRQGCVGPASGGGSRAGPEDDTG